MDSHIFTSRQKAVHDRSCHSEVFSAPCRFSGDLGCSKGTAEQSCLAQALFGQNPFHGVECLLEPLGAGGQVLTWALQKCFTRSSEANEQLQCSRQVASGFAVDHLSVFRILR